MAPGYILLSACRSGSTWLSDLANASGTMGRCDEWLQLSHLSAPARSYTPDSHFDEILRKASGENGRFAVKVFPAEYYKVHGLFGYDFVRRACVERGAVPVLLRRRDLLGQAISFRRGVQTGTWHSSDGRAAAEPRYDYAELCEAVFYLSRSMQFWTAYLLAMGLDHVEFVYEDLLDDPGPYLDHLAGSLGVARVTPATSRLSMLRDDTTEAWRTRFLADAGSIDLAEIAHGREQPSRTLANLGRFLRKRPMRPFPFAIRR
jgi:LPS sulfotransferase NodH